MELFETIGNTPLIRLYQTEKRFGIKTPLFAKVEYFNLTGSIKDRAAYNILMSAKNRGLLKDGDYIVEATSGNMGISLAAIGKKLGYKPVIVIPEGFSKERISLIKAYGGDVRFTPSKDGMDGAVKKAEELSRELNGFYVDQFNNPDNYEAHYKTTAPEIYNQLNGDVSCLVAGVGSGGTITGMAKFLKEKRSLTVCGVEPESSPLLSQNRAGKHRIQGIGANFIPSILDKKIIDGIITVSDDDAEEFTKILATTEGLLCGVSSGAAYAAAVRYLQDNKVDGNTIVIFPDGGLKYMSIGLFE